MYMYWMLVVSVVVVESWKNFCDMTDKLALVSNNAVVVQC